ncbi:hypothetical protein ACWEN3_00660 [Streptomyces sp. NPDC004561]
MWRGSWARTAGPPRCPSTPAVWHGSSSTATAAVRLCQPDDGQPSRLKVYAALPDEAQVQAPSIGVTSISARHVAREITRRLHPLHAEAAELTAQIAARQQAEASARAAVADAVAGALPGARIE